MSTKEIKRVEVMQKLVEKGIKQVQAAELLGVNLRHIKRLYSKYKKEGAKGLISKKRGKPSNHRLPIKVKELTIALVKEHYYDFGPTLAQEKLSERHGIKVSVNTVRSWMIEAKIWIAKRKHQQKVYQPRARRSCYGELVQIDGSDHPWFEDRGPRCVLLVYVDDATSKLLLLVFVPLETTNTYFEAMKKYFRKYGKPISFYSDRNGIFIVEPVKGKKKVTQFGRALQELSIELINAKSPQAKGRVERVNETLQDRLVKELRLMGISTIEQANAYLPTFIEDYNAQFGKPPANEVDVHRPLQEHELNNLEDILCWREQRSLSKSLTLQYHNMQCLIEDNFENRQLRGKRLTIHHYPNGLIKIKHEGRELSYRVLDEWQRAHSGTIIHLADLHRRVPIDKLKIDAKMPINPKTLLPSPR